MVSRVFQKANLTGKCRTYGLGDGDPEAFLCAWLLKINRWQTHGEGMWPGCEKRIAKIYLAR